jgi:tetratricopeptide (TPR) repeat protein
MNFFQKPPYIKELQRLNCDAELFKIESILLTDPGKSVAWYLKGTLLLHKNNINDALYCFDKAIAIDPNDKVFRYKKSIALQLKGDYDAAIESCNKAIEKNYVGAIKKKIELLMIKADLAYKEKAFAKALHCHEEALVIQPNNIQILLLKSCILIVLMRYEEALVCIEQTLQIDFKHIFALIIKAIIHLFLRQESIALESIEILFTIDAENAFAKTVRKNFAFLRAAKSDAYNSFLRTLIDSIISGLVEN